ncbi:MAG TPA: sigma-70 family RNA polymerase sigma factor [Sumerlaeia bacterium]|nr:sigma-70 family RNA polymerase sigma factor [Sumerlaeia bacterium]
MSRSDDSLIARYLEGDAEAFEDLYRRYASRLLGFVLSLGADRDAAEDLAQRTWLRALEALDAYKPRGRFRPWLFQTAYRLWVDEKRSGWERRRTPVDSEEELEQAASSDRAASGAEGRPPADPREQASACEERELVEAALKRLPEEMSRTVLLRIDGDLAYREIAELMGCPLGTVLWRMSEAQRRLARELASVRKG